MPCNCPDCRAARGESVDTPDRVYCDSCGYYRNAEGEAGTGDCVCESCANCGESCHPDYLCPECGYSRRCGCCDCSGDVPWCDTTGEFHGQSTKRHPRFTGVEIECGLGTLKSRELRSLTGKWGSGIHSDGSVNAGDYSIELVTSPARGDAFVSQVRETCAVLAACKTVVDKSCGLHVHVDARDLTTASVLTAVRLYARVERSLYGLVARSRRSNTYCGPWGDALTKPHYLSDGRTVNPMDKDASLTDRERALDVATYGSEREARYAKESREKHGSRYHGLNLNALAVHGTIEFRLHHGTVNPDKIIMWAAVCNSIVEFASKHTESEVENLRGTPAEILEKVIGDPEVTAWCRARRTYFEDMERKRRGLPPRRAARTARPDPAEVPAMPVEPGEDEPYRERRARSW